MKIDLMNGQLKNGFLFAKNKKGDFIFCNENLAKAAGLDSPQQMIGKDDFSLHWRKQADFFRGIDDKVKEGCVYTNQWEVIETYDSGKVPIVASKNLLLNENNECVGIIGCGCSIEVMKDIHNQQAQIFLNERPYYLNCDEYLTQRELEVLKYLVLAYSNKKIAVLMNISHRTAEVHITNLKRKLQCRTRGDIIVTAIKLGLIYLIMGSYTQNTWKCYFYAVAFSVHAVFKNSP